MQVKSSNKKEAYPETVVVEGQLNVSQPANYKAIPPVRTGNAAYHLFSLFTADIITQDVIFVR